MFAILRFLFVCTALGPLTGLLGIPWALLSGNVEWMYRKGLWISAAAVRAAGIRVELTGLENVPAGRACIFMANHVSNLDPPVLMPLIPGRLSVMLKSELMRIPILGTAMRMAKFIPVDRSSNAAKAKVSIDAAAEALHSGIHILIFAEGSRSQNGRLMRFKKGPFYLARETGAPVIPVAISGTEKMMRRGGVRIFPGTARVQMLPMIDSTQFATRDDLMTAVRGAINAALPPEMQNPRLA
jgi:1-acyl-sn-glycerol-3-phosphate acyltransferase